MACNARINSHKSLAVFLPGTELTTPFKRVAWDQEITYLGIILKSGAVAAALQRSRIVTAIEQRLERWKDRDLSLRGRVLLLNTFALSRLWFAAHVMPFDDITLAALTKAVRGFLWRGKRAQVSFAKITQPRHKGGLGLLPAKLQSQCMLSKWFCRVFERNAPPWTILARDMLQRRLDHCKMPPHQLLAPARRTYISRMSAIWRARM